MKLIILYHPNSEGSRVLEEYAHEIEAEHSYKVDLMSLETRQGAALASLYDVVRYPAMVVVDDLGHPQKDWQGQQLPLKDEVFGYLAA
jgi:hypothetical protein